jgi:hypothetical protein
MNAGRKPPDTAVRNVANDQMHMPSTVERFVPMRSASAPQGIAKTTQVHRKAENRYPSWTVDRWNSCAMGLADTESTMRSI